MVRKEKSKKKFPRASEEEDFRPKRKKNPPKRKYKNHQLWLEEAEEFDLEWKEDLSTLAE